jgi:hypothetical protein
MAKTYEDIGKDATEFITKGFPNAGTFKVIAETKAPNGVSVKATGTRSFDFKDANTVEEKVSAEVEPKLKCDDIEVSGKLSTLGEYEAGVTFDNLFTKGAKASVTAAQSDKDGNSLKGSASFKNDDVAVKVGVKYPFKPSHVNYSGELTYHNDKIHAGVSATYDRAANQDQDKDKFNYNIKAGYIAQDQQFVVSVENQPNKDKKTTAVSPVLSIFSVNYLYSLSSALKFGFGAAVEKKNLRGPEIHTSTEYKVDKDTVIKSKLSFVNSSAAEDRDVRLAVAVKQNVSERVNVTVGADINARALLQTPRGPANLGATKPHSFGFEVKFQ